MALAGFLLGLGSDAFQAATLGLVPNTAPVVRGGGNPIHTLAGVTESAPVPVVIP